MTAGSLRGCLVLLVLSGCASRRDIRGVSQAGLFPREQVEAEMSTVRILADEAETRCASSSPPAACPSVEEAWQRVGAHSRQYADAMESWFEARELNVLRWRDFSQATVEVRDARQAYEQSVLALAQPAAAVMAEVRGD